MLCKTADEGVMREVPPTNQTLGGDINCFVILQYGKREKQVVTECRQKESRGGRYIYYYI